MACKRALWTLGVLICAALALGAVGANPTPAAEAEEDTMETNAIAEVPDEREKLPRATHRSVMIDIARELIARTTGNSQVLSLSVTNLVILLVLKALLLGAALFSYGAWRRSADEDFVKSFGVHVGRGISEGEILLILTYLMGDTGGSGEGFDCMYRVACEEPDQAKEYLSASRMLLKGAKLFTRLIPYNPKYEHIVYGLQEAVDHGQRGQECAAKYRCTKD
ncbi:uncharacterized protein LOC124154659 [Ischnura elegans]|uniref:uncharacterized protein LOC124154659 n=1 Tax=Ischnura elegans TaxID=197161 RepID=UPI001ED8834C|nr:uncharacterized protein LOC124154659 [Ischnura elegans]